MAKEPGFTQIPHKILEHFMKIHLSSNQWQVLVCIFRKTYGYHKKVDYIANKQIVEATGLGKTVVSRVLHDLNDMQLISRKGKCIGVQEDWGKWKELAKQPTLGSKLAEQSTLLDNKSKQNSQPKLAEQLTKVSSPRVTQNIINTITKDREAPTAIEVKVLDILRELKGWRYDQADDLAWLRGFVQDFPDFDLEQLKLARDYYSGRPPPKHKGIWRKRLRNWMLKKPEFEGLKETPGPRGKSFEQWKREQQEEGT